VPTLAAMDAALAVLGFVVTFAVWKWVELPFWKGRSGLDTPWSIPPEPERDQVR